LNEPRQELAAAALDGRIYTIGGLSGRANANEIYDAVRDAWTPGADFPVDTDHAWAVPFGGRIFAGGGRTNRVFSYDPAANAWTEVASSRFVHGGTPAAAVIGALIYVAGGTGGAMTGNEVEAYDPAADRWTSLAPMRCARNHTAGAVIGGRLYVAGGRPGSQDCLEVYDPATDTWTPRAPMPTGRSGVAGAALSGCFYVFGGEGNERDPNGIFPQVEAYDPATDTWTQLPPMPIGRHGIYAAVLGNAIHLPGGATQQGFGVTGIHDAFVVEPRARRPDPVPRPRNRRVPPELPPRTAS
jgi:N-acetylneuraminic acid mutarotase